MKATAFNTKNAKVHEGIRKARDAMGTLGIQAAMASTSAAREKALGFPSWTFVLKEVRP